MTTETPPTCVRKSAGTNAIIEVGGDGDRPCLEQSNSCVVWWTRRGMLRPRHLQLLDPSENRRRLAYQDEADRERFALGAAVLRLAVASVVGTDPARLEINRQCDSCDRPHGRPRVAGGQLHVSVSHSANCIAVAVTAVAPIGIDVAQVWEVDSEGLAERILGPSEVVTRPREFFVYWTRKESVVKATGAGLRIAPRDVVVSRPHVLPQLVSYAGSPMVASMRDLRPGIGYVGALTILSSTMPLIRQLDAATLLGPPD